MLDSQPPGATVRPPSPSLRAHYLRWRCEGTEGTRLQAFFSDVPAAKLQFPRSVPLELPRDQNAEEQSELASQRLTRSVSDFKYHQRLLDPIYGGSAIMQLACRRIRGLDCEGSLLAAHPLPSRGSLPQMRPSCTLSRGYRRSMPRTSVVAAVGEDAPQLDERANGRALQILKETQFFVKMEAESQGLTEELSHHVHFESERAGQILFRQGDPPRNCYVIVRGQVGVYICGPGEDKPATPRDSYEPYRYPTFTDFSRRSEAEAAKPSKASAKNAGLPPPLRFSTTEGGNTFNIEPPSTLGVRIAALGAGTVFGELALQNDDVRSATIRCSRDTELLVIPKAPFQQVMSQVLGKNRFFNTHLPGMKNLEYRLVHPSLLFQRKVYEEGHCLLREGIQRADPLLVLIRKGNLEIRRYRRASDNPAYRLAARPLATPAFSKLGVRAAAEGALPVIGGAGSLPGALGTAVGLLEQEVAVERVGATGVVCSLAFFPLPGGEPFTVAAAAGGCEAYCATGADVQRLPTKIVRAVRKQALQDLEQRLKLLEGSDGSTGELPLLTAVTSELSHAPGAPQQRAPVAVAAT